MFKWEHQVLREEAGEGEGGGATATVTETAEQKELREAREENTRLKSQNEELSASEREWSRIARQRTAAPAAAEPAPAKEEATDEEIETGEKLLDDISKDGLKALRKRGFVRIDQVKHLIDESIERAQGDGRGESQFQSVMANEFPEMQSDLARLDKGLKPESPLFVLAAEIYQDAIALDPQLKGSKSTLIMATRQAAAQLELSGKRKAEDVADKQAQRRNRIDAQRPDRSTKSEAAEETGLTAKQKQMAADMGISEEKFQKQQDKIRGQRGK